MKKNILFLVHNFNMGGVQAINVQLINNLNKNDYEVHVLYMRKGILFDNLELDNIYINKLGNAIGLKSPKILLYIYKINQYIKNNNIDLINSIDPISYILGSTSSKASKIKHIRVQPNFITVNEPHHAKLLNLLPFQKWTNLYITLNEAANQDLVSAGVSKEKVLTIRGFAKIEEFLYPNEIKDIKAELGIPKDMKIITAIHRMVYNKGYETFIEMIPYILKDYNNVAFLLVGDGPLRATLEEKVKKLKISNYVHFLGFRKDIIDIAHNSTFGIYPEGKSVAMGTLLRAGKVLISKKDSTMDEFIIHNETGYLTMSNEPEEYAHYALMLLKDDIHLKEMQEKQIIFSSKFLDGKSNQIIYEELVDSIIDERAYDAKQI